MSTPRQVMEAMLYIAIALGGLMAMVGLAFEQWRLLIMGLIWIAVLGFMAFLVEDQNLRKAARKRESL